jgi:hypothetical protein
VIIAVGVFFLIAQPGFAQKAKSQSRQKKKTEKITYVVKKGLIQLGRATFSRTGELVYRGKPVYCMTFQTTVTGFFDLEKIYCDRDTFLPLRIERDVRQFPGRETIVEEYDQTRHTVTITKTRGRKTDSMTIRKDGPIQNAILLPYYVRRIPEFGVGWTYVAHLPTKDITLTLVGMEEVKVPSGTFQTYRFESTPRQIEIWITADEKRIPVKIVGTGLLGYAMFMKEYKSQ